LRRRVLAAWLAQDHPGRHVSEELLEKIFILAGSTRAPSQLNLPGGAHICRRSARLFVKGSATM